MELTAIKHTDDSFNLEKKNTNESSKSFHNSSMNDDSYNRFIEGSELFKADAIYNVDGTRSDSDFLQGDHSEDSRSQSQFEEDSQKSVSESSEKYQSNNNEKYENYERQKRGDDSGVYEYQYGSNSKSNGESDDIRDDCRKNAQSLFSPEFEKRLSEIKTSNYVLSRLKSKK